jgi:hypothetical protein
MIRTAVERRSINQLSDLTKKCRRRNRESIGPNRGPKRVITEKTTSIGRAPPTLSTMVATIAAIVLMIKHYIANIAR